MKDRKLKQILKAADAVDEYNIDIPDMSEKIKRLLSNANLSQENIVRTDIIKTNRGKLRTKRWAWLVPLTACLVAGIICAAIILPGLFKGNELTLSSAESRYMANSYQVAGANENDRIKYSYSYNDKDGNEYDFYYIYLGEMLNVPLCYKGPMRHSGGSRRYSFTTTQESMKDIGVSIAEGSAEALKVAEDNTFSKTGEKIGTELAQAIRENSGTKVTSETDFKVAAEAGFDSAVSDPASNVFKKETSLEKTISRATSFAQSTQETYEYSLTKDDPAGYYRLTLFMSTDIYLYVIRDSSGKPVYYEFKECIKPDSLIWGLDYSEESFKKVNDTKFELNSINTENLPEPKVHLGGGSKSIENIYDNLKAKISVSDSLIYSIVDSEDLPVTNLPHLTGVRIEIKKDSNIIKTFNFSEFTNLEFDLSEYIFEKDLVICGILNYNLYGDEFQKVLLDINYSCVEPYANLKAKISIVSDKLIYSIIDDRDLPITSLPHLTDVKIEVKKDNVVKTFTYSEFTNFEFDLSEHIFGKNLEISGILKYKLYGKEFQKILSDINYSCVNPYDNIEANISIVSDKLIFSIIDSDLPVTSLPNLTGVRIEVNGEVFYNSKPTNFKFDFSKYIFEKNLEISSTLSYNLYGKAFQKILTDNYSYTGETDLNVINNSSKEIIFIDLFDQNTAQGNIEVQPNVKEIFINGDPDKFYTNISFVVLTRPDVIVFNFNNFSFSAPIYIAATAINANCNLELNITGTCKIYGGIGNQGQSGGIGIKANNLTINGTGNLEVTGGEGGYGYHPGGKGYTGGNGITCKALNVSISKLTVTGGKGGAGGSANTSQAGDGGTGGNGIYCTSKTISGSTNIQGGKGGDGGLATNSEGHSQPAYYGQRGSDGKAWQ